MHKKSRLATGEEREIFETILNERRTMKTKIYTYENRTRCMIPPSYKGQNKIVQFLKGLFAAIMQLIIVLLFTAIAMMIICSTYWLAVSIFSGDDLGVICSSVITFLCGIIGFILLKEQSSEETVDK